MMLLTRMLLLLGHVAWASSSSQLRIEEKPQDKVLEAFDKLTLRCIITGGDVKFLWTYVNAQTKTLESLTDNQMAVIKTKDHTSTLTINPVTTVDSGSYKCCAHLINSDENDAACASAKVTVNFGSSNSGSSDVGTVPTDPSPGFDLCHPYPEQSQGICKQWLGGSIVHADSSTKINDIEKQIQRILEMMSDDSQLSEQCGKYAPRAFCHYLLPTCLENGNSQKRLCRSDCEMLKYSKCAQEFRNIKNGPDNALKLIANQFQCDHLPDINSDKICTGIDLPPVLDKQHICYSSTGIGYRGGENVTKSGSKCVKWEDANQKPFTSENFPELSGGHFFCRNPVSTKYPEAEMSRPWCYTRDSKNKSKFVQEECQVPLCEPDNLFTNEILMVLLPSIAISLVLALIGVTYCVCRRRSPKGGKGTEFGAPADQPVDSTNEGLLSPSQYKETTYMNASIGQFGQNYKKLKLPELSFSSIVCRKELGEAYYGVVYLADVLPNLLYSPNHPCAAKSLNENTNTQQIHQFWREMEMLSELRHDRIANLRAVVIQPQLRAMIFEYTDLGDLKNYLLARNPNSDMPSHAGPLTLEQQIDICHQICEGMEYLSSGDRPYVHRDLAARNILIDSNLQIKISNIGIARMETKNDYFNPQTSNEGNEPAQTLIPVRWMSPESLLEANYTMASDVWSYAVCCWEVFSMGTQPFCGYSNEEVMELVIHRKQVLPCPETCPLQIYNLLINCWSYVAYSRPAFTRIGVVLDQFRKSVPRKQYAAASTVSFNSNQLYRQRSQVQHQVAPPSSTDNSTVGAPSFYPLSGTPQSIGAPPSGHMLLQQRDHQAPPASPVSHSNYRYPTGTRSTTGSSAESSAIGNGLAVPEELLRPLIPNSSRGNHESRDPGFQNQNMYVQEPKMYNRNYSQQR